MSDLVGNPEDRISHNEAQFAKHKFSLDNYLCMFDIDKKIIMLHWQGLETYGRYKLLNMGNFTVRLTKNNC